MIKKMLLLAVAISMLVACKKDEEATPSDSSNPSVTTDTGSGNNSVGSGTVQERLDAGQTPKAIYNSDSKLLDSLYGKTYAGGLIFYLDTANSRGLVAASTDQSSSEQWGCNTTLIKERSCFQGQCFDIVLSKRENLFTGNLNSDELSSNCPAGMIKNIESLNAGTYKDWFIPNKNEAKKMFDKLSLTGTYWSSTQHSTTRAWSVSATLDSPSKSKPYKVRAVRKFTY